ncbi:unnamed protein product [Urochloa decumbens]|uniref:DUF4220 domain-containing protein n=1 Tax=Urochloa decumbens TaxID=240449 RepID=A0ABC9AJX7_9POAL
MDISSALDWWDEWKLRVLVLGSTVIQLFLFVYGAARRAPTPPWFRLCIWLAYLAGDSLAIYALATLFNRHGREAQARSTLEVLWAPVLLIHLAGQEQITAYSVQDNELWRRHVVTLVSQVAVALFVFCKSWSGERRLLVAAILMFAIGIYKFSIKPWALKRASFRELVRSPVSVARRKKLIGFSGRWADCWRDWTETIKWPSMVSGLPLLGSYSLSGELSESVWDLIEAWTEGREEQVEEEGREEELKLQEYVEKAKDITGGQSAEDSLPLFLGEAEAFAADLIIPYSRRLSMLQFMLHITDKMGAALWVGLLEVYACLYTRVKVTLTHVGIFLRLLTFSLAVAAIVLFARSHKPHQDGSAADIKVTYILFCCVALLELLSFANMCIFLTPAVIWPASFKHTNMVAQQSLMSCAARRRKPTRLLRLAALVGCDDYFNKHWYITHTPSLEPIRDAVRAHALKGWLEYIHDAATYRSFNDMRGEWAVGKRSSKHPLDPATRNHCLVLLNSFKAPFDESVLLWHIATEICFHHTSHRCGALVSLIPDGNADAAAQSSSKRMMNAHVISCYMMSLLSVRPEMLMLGTRQHLFSVALDDIEYIALRGEVNKNHDLGCGILRSVLHVPWVYADCVGPLIPKACKLAMPLLQLLQLQEADTWEMLEGVWVEMLCYAAGRCRGYLHAERLGEGCSELLTQIWLLLCYLGMETLADRLQRRLPEGN